MLKMQTDLDFVRVKTVILKLKRKTNITKMENT